MVCDFCIYSKPILQQRTDNKARKNNRKGTASEISCAGNEESVLHDEYY